MKSRTTFIAILIAIVSGAQPIQSYANDGRATICVGSVCRVGIPGSATFNFPCSKHTDETIARYACRLSAAPYLSHKRYNTEHGGECGPRFIEVYCR